MATRSFKEFVIFALTLLLFCRVQCFCPHHFSVVSLLKVPSSNLSPLILNLQPTHIKPFQTCGGGRLKLKPLWFHASGNKNSIAQPLVFDEGLEGGHRDDEEAPAAHHFDENGRTIGPLEDIDEEVDLSALEKLLSSPSSIESILKASVLPSSSPGPFGLDREEFYRYLSAGAVPLGASLAYSLLRKVDVRLRMLVAIVAGLSGYVIRNIVLDNMFSDERFAEFDPSKYLLAPEYLSPSATFLSSNNSSTTANAAFEIKYSPNGDIILPAHLDKALHQLVDDPLIFSKGPSHLASVAAKYRVKPEESSLLIAEMLKLLILRVTAGDEEDLTGLKDLLDFAVGMNFTRDEVSSGVGLAALRVGELLPRDERGFYAETYDPRLLLQASKIFFIADKTMGTTLTGFYGNRLLVTMAYFMPEELRQVITAISQRTFRSCVDCVMSQPSDYTADEIVEVKKFLTVGPTASDFRPSTMEALISQSLHNALDELLGEHHTINSSSTATTTTTTTSTSTAAPQVTVRVSTGDGVSGMDEDKEGREYDSYRESVAPAVLQPATAAVVTSPTGSNLTWMNFSHSLNTSRYTFASLRQANQVLGWSNNEFESTLRQRTLPIFRHVASSLIHRVLHNPTHSDSLSGLMYQCVLDLQLDESAAQGVVVDIVSAANKEYLDKINRVFAVSEGSIEAAYKVMTSYSRSWSAIQRLTQELFSVQTKRNVFPTVASSRSAATSTSTSTSTLPLPGLPFADAIRIDLFQMQLERQAEGRSRHSSVHTEMFNMSANDQILVRRCMALPRIAAWIQRCLDQNDFGAEAKRNYTAMIDEYGVDAAVWQSTATDFYYQEVNRVATSQALPSSEDILRLREVRAFLNCPQDAVNKVHINLFGSKFTQALLDAMGPTGVISAEYESGLDRLRERLELDQDSVTMLLGVAMRSRLPAVVKGLVGFWKSDAAGETETPQPLPIQKKNHNNKKKNKKTQSVGDNSGVTRLGFVSVGGEEDDTTDSEDGEKDEGQATDSELDPSSSISSRKAARRGFLTEVLNIAECVEKNYLMVGVSVDSIPLLPINVVDMLTEDDLVGLYHHFLLSRLTEPDMDLRSRCIRAEAVLTKVLGMDDVAVRKLKMAFTHTMWKQLVSSVLESKERADESDLQQFQVLSVGLGMNASDSEDLYRTITREAILEHVERIVDDDDRPVVAATARILRNQVNSLRMNVSSCFSEEFALYLYSLEVQHYIETSNMYGIHATHEFYDIPDSVAEEIIDASSNRYVNQILNFALRGAKRFNQSEAVQWAVLVHRFSPYIKGCVDADGTLYSDADKSRLIEFYVESLRERREAELDNIEARQTTTVYPSPSPSSSQSLSLSSSHDSSSDPDHGSRSASTVSQSLDDISDSSVDPLLSADEEIFEAEISRVVKRLEDLIHVTDTYVPPMEGIEGLSSLKSASSIAKTQDMRKKWAWGD